ncbi:MAG: hypothetical protein AMXMBFR33_67740 [Candidatus Xenobia bacterium]
MLAELALQFDGVSLSQGLVSFLSSRQQVLGRLWPEEGQLMQQARRKLLTVDQLVLESQGSGTLLRELDGLGGELPL